MRVEDFSYDLPPELIAQTPLEHRSDSRLMVVDPVSRAFLHRHFHDLPDHLQPGDVLVLNDSKVLPARLFAVKQGTGAHVELLLTKPVTDTEWYVMAKPAKRLHLGTVLTFVHADRKECPVEGVCAEIVEVCDDGLRRVRFSLQESMESFLSRAGQMPLPPYIHAPLENKDRYQTVYAKTVGSVAAPTAGLHFTPELLDALRDKGVQVHRVTLHVGIGTFKPVQVERVEDHVMHSESYEVGPEVADAVNAAKREGRRVIAVGTTALRTLESASVSGRLLAGRGETDIFIYPGYDFRCIDALITNFHLPKSTLLMLVSALAGKETMQEAYALAVQERYRFFSFGDAMFISRRIPFDEATGMV